MAQRKVTAIPATISRYTATPINSTKKRRVAGYARVSTDHEDQTTSYEAQVDYYTNYIKSRDDWEFVAIYTDEGISATNTKKREGFKAMIADALAGKIDLIVTKSVSRFARNTVDSLTTVRKLKDEGIEIYFEKENIWTLDSKGELLITIMSSLAQEESRSISENVTWGQRKRMADGKVSFAYSRFLGLDKDKETGKIVVNPEQAETVRLIFQLFLEGMTPHSIAVELTSRGIKTPGGKDVWNQQTVRRMLSNEKYKGDALLQKEFTVDFLQKKMKKNEGEVPQYYVEGNHEAIISPAVFDMVQAELAKRTKGGTRYSGVSIFSNKIKCADCGGWYGSKVWHSTDRYRKVIYRCNRKYNGEKCQTPVESILLLTRGSGLFKGIPICLVERPVAYNQDVKCLEAQPGVNIRFIYYWLKSQEPFLKARLEVTGIGAGKFDTKLLSELAVPLPNQIEQSKIVSFADAISEKIIANKQINDHLAA